METPLVSIIMAAYNAEKTIDAAIKSVVSQTYIYWELIIIDDCSKDRTGEIVSEYLHKDQRIHLLQNITNQGVSYSRKKGLDFAQGIWIAVLDSDDLWKADKLEKQLALAKTKNAELIFTGSAFIDYEGNPKNWELRVPKELSYRQLLKQNLISNSSVLVKKELYQQYYVFGDDMHEDFSLWLSITQRGTIAYGIDEPLLIYRIAKNSKSGNKIRAAKMNWNTYRYNGLNRFSAFYYMCWYTIKSILKYRHLT